MSRTIKDKPYKCFKEDLSKKKKQYYPKFYGDFGKEPGWFKRMFTTRRNRNYFQRFKAKINTCLELDLIDPFNVWNKPHVYYW